MTETEAYKVLGWPVEGEINSFILPATGDGREYRAWKCECGMRGVTAVDWSGNPSHCKGCGGVMVEQRSDVTFQCGSGELGTLYWSRQSASSA